MALLRAGKHVLTEKPMATCLAECDEMLDAARAGRCLLGVVAQNRFKTPMMKLKRVLESGLLGKILHAQVDSLWWRGSNYYDLWWRGTWAKEGGGCTMNHAVHQIDLFLWMMGLPAEVSSISLNLAHENSEVEDFSTSILTYRQRQRRADHRLAACITARSNSLSFKASGPRSPSPGRSRPARKSKTASPKTTPRWSPKSRRSTTGFPRVTHEGHDGQIANFLAAIEGREPLLVDGEQGRRTLELITAIYQSGHLGQRVRLPLAADSPFYSRDGVLRHARHFHEKTRSVENFANNEITLGRNVGK